MSRYVCSLHRKQEIEDGLLKLMGQLPYEDITVKDLTEQLHIARKTFYQYFPNKQACLESLTDRLILEFDLAQLQNLSNEATRHHIYAEQLNYWICHRDFLEAMIANKLGSFLLSRFLMHFRRENQQYEAQMDTGEEAFDEDILFFYISGQLYLLLKWCHEGFVLSVDEMATKYVRLIHEPWKPADFK